MMGEDQIIAGNDLDLEEFCNYLPLHDRRTVESYYRIAKVKKSVLVIRRPQTRSPQIQVLIVAYQIAAGDGGIIEALRGKQFHRSGWIQALPFSAQTIFVFGELLPQIGDDTISEFMASKHVRRVRKKKETV